MSHSPGIPGAETAGGHTPADHVLPDTSISLRVNALVRFVGRITSWVWVLLIGVIIYNVIQRYVFSIGSIALEELQWHLYAVGFMIGLSYCFVEDRHVRVDVVAEQLRTKTRAVIEMLGLSLLLIPFTTAILVEAVPFIWTSWSLSEVSSAPSGLPFRWLLKSFIFWGFGLLLLAALARLTRCTAAIFGWPKPIWPKD